MGNTTQQEFLLKKKNKSGGKAPHSKRWHLVCTRPAQAARNPKGDPTMPVQTLPRLALSAETARDLMSEAPVSIRADASLRDAIVLLADKGYSAAPVINQAGHPVG